MEPDARPALNAVSRTSRQVSFGEFRLDRRDQSLWKSHEEIALRPKSMAVLEYLATNAGRLVTKQELLDEVWADSFVGDGVLKLSISEIRDVLGDRPQEPRFIQTVSRKGYRFVADTGVGNLGPVRSKLIGRGPEVVEIKRLLATNRLVTLHGPPGVGKSSLALAVASGLEPIQPVLFVDLGLVTDPFHVPEAVSDVVGGMTSGGESVVDSLVEAIAPRHVFLVLDNCEHVQEACSSLTDRLLDGCEHLRVIATSRDALRVTGEVVWAVTPLAFPVGAEPLDELLRFDAVQLFVDRARGARASFVASEENAEAIARICRELDGLPLAIELAAAWVTALSPEEIAVRLRHSMAFLTKGRQAGPLRHRTLAAALDWSFNEFSREERALFAGLSVFSGDFTLADLAAVINADSGDESEQDGGSDVLFALVDHGVVMVSPDSTACETRYRLLHTIRQYAQEKLPPDLAVDLARRHAEYFCALAEENGRRVHDADSEQAVNLLVREGPNLDAALSWSRQDDSRGEYGLRIAASLWWFWVRTGQLRKGIGWLEEALTRDPGGRPCVRAAALCGSGLLLIIRGEPERARACLEESVRLYRTSDDEKGLGLALSFLGRAFAHSDDLEAGETAAAEAVMRLNRYPDTFELGLALRVSGAIAQDRGRMADVEARYERSIKVLRAASSPWALTGTLLQLANVSFDLGRDDRARGCWHDALIVLRRTVDVEYTSLALRGVAWMCSQRGDHARAAQLLGSAVTMQPAADARYDRQAFAGSTRALVHDLRDALGQTEWASEFEKGRGMLRDSAIDVALMVTRPSPKDVHPR